jgi:vancomycin permeability regulator SanA
MVDMAGRPIGQKKIRGYRTHSLIWFLVPAVVIGVLAGVAVLAPNLIIPLSVRGHTVTWPEDAPRAQVAIVLGARVYPNGTPSPMLADRLQTGVNLYKLGKVDKLLLSGDHGQTTYDEVNVMLEYVLARGVPRRGRLHRPRGLQYLRHHVPSPRRVQSHYGTRGDAEVPPGPSGLYGARNGT